MLLPRQCDDNCGAAVVFGFDMDTSTMRFYDSTDDGQTESGSLGLRGIQDGGERALLQLGVNSFAGVLELYCDVRCVWTRER